MLKLSHRPTSNSKQNCLDMKYTFIVENAQAYKSNCSKSCYGAVRSQVKGRCNPYSSQTNMTLSFCTYIGALCEGGTVVEGTAGNTG